MCARRRLSLALIAAAGLEATGAAAAAPSARRTRCGKAHDTCLDAAGAQRNGLRAACTGDRAARTVCRTEAKATFKSTVSACRTIRRECKACCRTTGEPCKTLRLVADTPRAASAVVTETGGTLRTTAPDGTVYTLAVPAGALTVPETITVTPITAVGHLPLSGGLVAAAEFAPDGLDLLRPATLTVELPADVVTDGVIGFGAESGGAGFHLRVVERAARRVTLAVTHFSAAGAAVATTEDLQAILSQPPTNPEFCGRPEGAPCLGDDWAADVTATAPGAIRVVLRRKADAVEGVGSTSAFSATIDAVTANGRDFVGAAPGVPTFGVAAREVRLPSPAPGVVVNATLDPPLDDVCMTFVDGQPQAVPISVPCIGFVAVHSAFLGSGLCGG